MLLCDTHAKKAILERLGGDLPISFEGETIHLADRSFTAGNVAVFATFPHLGNPERYVAVHRGVTTDAICWRSHLDMDLLPDYLVYTGIGVGILGKRLDIAGMNFGTRLQARVEGKNG